MRDQSTSPALSLSTSEARTPRVNLWEQVSFTVAHAVTAALLYCLNLSGLYRFGRAFGTLEWLVNHKRRRRFSAAMTRVLGRSLTPTERRRETREFFMRTRCDKLFYLIFDRIPRDTATRLLTIENQSLLDEARDRGHGVYVAMSHHGTQHVIGMLMAMRGYEIVGVRDRNEGALRRYVQRLFDERYPEFRRTRWLFADSYPREIYRCLREGLIVASAMDVNRVRKPNQKTEEVTICGEKRLFLSGPVHIAGRCRAPVLQALISSEPDFRYRVVILGPLVDPEKSDDETAAVSEAMRIYAANIEKHLQANLSSISGI
jgi:lauroyl/myristoyl acyltransferase